MLLSDDANSLQRLLTKLVNKKINAATSHIRRMIMSEDSNENPAEIYGKDGKIYYRSAGSAGTELNGSPSLWTVHNVGPYPAISPNPLKNIDLQKTQSLMNPNDIFIRLENPESVAGEGDTGLSYWWDDILGGAGIVATHTDEEAP